MLKKKVIVFLLLVLFLGAGGLEIKKRLLTPEPRAVKITVAQPGLSPDMIPHYLALKKGFFKEYLADVKIKTYSGKETPQETLARGKADIIIMELADFLYNRYRNADLVAFAALTAGEPAFIMARKNIPDFNWKDLKNKTIIGEPPESTAGILLETVLRRNELAPYRNVTVFYNIPDDLRKGAFKAECSTYLQASEPLVSSLELEGTARVIASLAGERIPALVYVTDSKHITKHPEKIQRFTNGIYKALLWMKYHSEVIAKDMAPEFKYIDPAIMNSAVDRYLREKIWPETPLVDEKSMQKFQNMMLAAGELPGTVECSGAVENKFARGALETVKYIPPEQKKKGLKKLWPF